jgi:hypothetical protein
MKYSTYLDSLDAILLTGKSNKEIVDAGKHKIYPALEEKLAAAGRVSEKEGKSIKETIQALFELCSDSPLVATADAAHLLSPLFRQSAAPPDAGKLPLVLSGPMVRRAVPEAVTVWIALKQEEIVALSVFEDLNGMRGEMVLSGHRATVNLGKNLHLTAVTAVPPGPDGKLLEYGKSYLYELEFQNSQQSLTKLELQ